MAQPSIQLVPPNNPQSSLHQRPQLQQQQPPVTIRDRIQSLIMRMNQLRAQGFTPETSAELDKIMRFIQNFQLQQQQQQQMLQQHQQQSRPSFPEQAQPDHVSLPNGHPSAPNGIIQPPQSITSGPIPAAVLPTRASPVSFTPEMVDVIRAQMQAFRYVSRNLPIPEQLHRSLRLSSSSVPDIEKILRAPDPTTAAVADAAVQMHKGSSQPPEGAPTATTVTKSADDSQADAAIKVEEPETQIEPADMPKGPFLEDDVNSGIYPYNAYQHPFTHLKRPADVDSALFASRLQRLIIPTIMPAGLDAHQILEEYDRFVEARIRQRIRELEIMPSTMGDGGLDGTLDDLASESKDQDRLIPFLHPPNTAHGKLRALIELKSLKVVEKQRTLRALVAERLTHGSLLPLNRADFRRVRRPTIRDARTTEQLERKQRAERERRAKHKHVEQLNVICDHGRMMIATARAAQDRVYRLGRAVQSLHAITEKEEQKRIERISKERLKALKADDEEAYMRLIDTAKDTRITHLLRQTDAYLDSLAQAVVAQQTESGQEREISFETEEGPASEATFGAQVMQEDSTEEKAKVDYYAVAHKISERVSQQPTILTGGTLKDYQLKGLQWMVSLYNNRLNGILADEMGLGKTIQTISLVAFLIEVKKQRGPYLVIVPLSTMTNWAGEFAKWAPTIRMISYKGNPQQRRNLQIELRMGQFQVLLTTYEYIIKDRPHLSKIKWIHMIIDEGHRMKNTQSKLSQTLTAYYHSRYRLILTGTPLQNNLPELWSLLNFVLPKIFNSVKSFDEWFNTPFANSGTGDKIELNEEEQLLIIRRLHKVLRPFLLRRLKKDVESELPDKVEKVIKVRMSALQSQLYKQMKKHKMIADGKNDRGKGGGVKGLSNELMQLRKICQHPFLFESVEDRMNPAGIVDDKLVRCSGKVELLSRILPKFFSTGHRVLIFFQMTKVMDIMEDFLKMMGWKYLRLDGGTKTDERAGHVQQFNAKDSDIQVFILSTRAGGLGLNLQTADTVIIFDSDWNPHADLQAQDRAHRIGQTKAVRILRFITEKSVEEAMYSRARFKLDIDDKVIQAGRFDNKSTQEEQEEFLRSILEADQEEENEEAGDMNDDELNMMLARNDDEITTFREMDVQRERDALDHWRAAGNRGRPPLPLLQFDELPECYQTEEPFEMKEVDDALEGRGQRRRNVVSYTDGLSDDAWALALEEGEDIQELSDRLRERNARRLTNKLLSAPDTPSRSTPVSDVEGRAGRKGKKGKGKVTPPDQELGLNVKRKRGNKSMSVTPSIQDNEDEDEERDMKRRKTKPLASNDVAPAIRDRMKKAFNECYKAVVACEDKTGRKRCELFKELPDRRDYADYYQVIKTPIALSQLRKRMSTSYYKTVAAFRDDWKLMFENARTYNQEGSWVYIDAEEMEKVFDATFDRVIAGSGLPGATLASGGASSSYESALTPVDDDERPLPSRSRGGVRKQVISDDEYLTSDED